jgi:hypothetical protein
MLAIERWGNLSHVQNVMQKTKENNKKVGKTNQDVSQVFTPRPKHDKI